MRALLLLFLALALSNAAAFAGNEPLQFDPDDGPPGALLFLAILGVGIALFVAGIGFAFAVFAAGCAVLLVGVGIFSSSVIIGILRRRVSSGLRAFHYLMCTAIAGPATMGALWLARTVIPIKLSTSAVCIFGFVAGVLGGLLFAFQMEVVARVIRRRYFPPVSNS